MKKFILVLALGSAVVANAQDSEFKPTAGAKNLEFQFTPLGGTPLGISGIRFRKFSSPTSAMRANLFLGFSSTSTVTQDADSDQDLKELKTKSSQFDINIRPGFENHFAGTDRLSPYVGAEVDIAYRMTSKKEEDQQGDDIVETKTTNEDGFFRFGINGVAGFDYYFAKKLYFGAELGLGIGVTAPFKTKMKQDSETVETKEGKDRIINFGPNVLSAIRLGYLF